MKKHLVKKIVFGLIVVFLSIIIFNFWGEVSAMSDYGVKDLVEKGVDKTGTSNSINSIMQSILTITQVIAVGIAVIMIIVIAIKYMLASPGDKASMKHTIIVYVTGAVILFAASGILEIVKNFAAILEENGDVWGSTGTVEPTVPIELQKPNILK